MDTLMQDVRYAARRLRRTPGFTLVAVLTLALGIGANSAIFSVVEAVLLRSLPFPQPDRLVRLFNVREGTDFPVSGANYLDFRRQDQLFTGVAAYTSGGDLNLTGTGEPTRLQGATVSGELFEVLGARPVLGRSLGPADNEPGAEQVAVLSHSLWQERFGGERDVVGRTVEIDGAPRTIVGVMPAGYEFPGETQIWLPISYSEPFVDDGNRGSHFLNVVARLQPGVTVERAAAEMRGLGDRMAREHPESLTNSSANAVAMHEVMVGDVRTPLLILLGAVGLVLLIACANVANLLLSRATARESEMAVRSALGAGRRRIVRQLLTESLLLALLGGALGLLLAVWGTELLVALRPEGVPRLDEVRVGGAVVGFTAAVALATGLLFGLVPALQISRGDLAGGIREGSRGTLSAARGNRVRSVLIVVEMALAVMLLAGAGLLIRSFVGLQQVAPGFVSEGLLSVDVSLPASSYQDDAARDRFYRQLEARIASVPGVTAVGAISFFPLSGSDMRLGVHEAGSPPPEPGSMPIMQARVASAGYFEAMGIRTIRGRTFTAGDRADAPRVVMLNERAVERYFPGQDPIGKQLVLTWGRGPDPDDQVGGEVVGIVGDVRQSSLSEEPDAQIYVPHAQVPIQSMDLTVRTSVPPMSVAGSIRQAVREVDPNLPVGQIVPVDRVLSDSVSEPRFYMLLLAIFAVSALVLAAIGIFGVMSYSVAQRTREIGIRVALGAAPGAVVRMIVRGALVLALGGIALGVGGTLAGSRLLAGLLFGVQPTDPLTLAAVVGILGAVALIASYVPARRATRVDPMNALRGD